MLLPPSTLVILRRSVLPTSHTTLLCTRAIWFEPVAWSTRLRTAFGRKGRTVLIESEFLRYCDGRTRRCFITPGLSLRLARV